MVKNQYKLQPKTCPSCGASFSCHGEDDCWCESYQIHKREALILSQSYTDCICPTCLSSYAEK